MEHPAAPRRGSIFRQIATFALMLLLGLALLATQLERLDSHWAAVQLVDYLFTTGRDAEAELLLRAFAWMDDVSAKTDGRIPQMLALVQGSMPLAAQWLRKHSVPPVRVAGWKIDQLQFRVGTEHHVRRHFRP